MPKKKQPQVDYSDTPETLDGHPFYGFQMDDDQRYFRDCIWDPNKKIILCDAKA